MFCMHISLCVMVIWLKNYIVSYSYLGIEY